MNLTLQDAIWVLPAEDAGEPGPVRNPERTEGEAQEWKLIVPLAKHEFRAKTVSLEKERLTVRYSGASMGEQAMLSLLARDADGAPLGLWRLERPTSAEGKLEVNLKALELPENAELYLFCEALNGAFRTNTASPLQALEWKATSR